jgi:hypothetical protein
MAIVPTARANNSSLAADDPSGDVEFACDKCETPMGKSFYPVHTYRQNIRIPYKFCPVCGEPAGDYQKKMQRRPGGQMRRPEVGSGTKRVRQPKDDKPGGSDR